MVYKPFTYLTIVFYNFPDPFFYGLFYTLMVFSLVMKISSYLLSCEADVELVPMMRGIIEGEIGFAGYCRTPLNVWGASKS